MTSWCSPNPLRHAELLQLVLAKLQEHKMYAASASLLSINAVGIAPDPDKVNIVQEWPVPQDVKQLRQLLGLAQYFRKFMQGFANLMGRFTRMLRKNPKWEWTATHEAAFLGIKQSLLSAPVLKLPSRDGAFTVISDASGVGIGAVLLQDGQSVAFEGRKLTDAELKWSATELEMLAVVYHLQKWIAIWKACTSLW